VIADRSFALLKNDQRHPSLCFKKIGRFWSVRVGRHHRTIGVEVQDGVLWVWIGNHSEYDDIVGLNGRTPVPPPL
jgi:hypothetical protein